MRPDDLLARLEAGYAYDPMYGQLCNERDQLQAENASLRGAAQGLGELCDKYKAENAKLWDELDRMTEAVEALHSAPLEDQLVQALNVADKLRELAQRMWRLERFGCYGCRQECDADSCYASDCKEAIEIEQEMQDIGIEV